VEDRADWRQGEAQVTHGCNRVVANPNAQIGFGGENAAGCPVWTRSQSRLIQAPGGSGVIQDESRLRALSDAFGAIARPASPASGRTAAPRGAIKT